MNPASRAAGIRRRRFTLITVAALLGAVYAGSPLVTPLYPLYSVRSGPLS
jgi:hypothetical protein